MLLSERHRCNNEEQFTIPALRIGLERYILVDRNIPYIMRVIDMKIFIIIVALASTALLITCQQNVSPNETGATGVTAPNLTVSTLTVSPMTIAPPDTLLPLPLRQL